MTPVFTPSHCCAANSHRWLSALLLSYLWLIGFADTTIAYGQQDAWSDRELQNQAKQALQERHVRILERDGEPPRAYLSQDTPLDEIDQAVALLGLAKIQAVQIATIRLNARQFRALAKCSALREIQLADTMLSTAEFRELAASKSLSSLWIGSVDLSAEALQALASAPNLRSMTFDCNKFVTDEHLSFLPKLRLLESLRFEECERITDVGMKYVGEVRGLKRLRVTGSQISDHTMNHIAKLGDLELLTVHAADVSDHGLLKLRNCTKLTELILYQTRVTAGGVLQLRGHVNLTRLSLWPTLVSSENFKRLTQTWPDLKNAYSESSWVWQYGIGPPWRDTCIDVDSRDIRIWDVATGKQLMSGGLGEGRAEFLGDGRLAIIAYSGISLLDVASGGVVGELRYPKSMASGWADDLRFSPNGRYIALRIDEGHLGIYDVRTGRQIRLLNAFGECKEIVWSPNSQGLAFATERAGSLRWRCHSNGVFGRAFKSRDDLNYFAFAPDGKTIAYSPRTGYEQENFIARIISFPHGRTVREFPVPGPFSRFRSDGKLLVHRMNGDGLFVIDPVSGRTLGRADGFPDGSVVAPDQSWCATISNDNEVHIIDARTGKRRMLLRHKRLEGKKAIIDIVSISKDGRMIATSARPTEHDWPVLE